MNPGEQLFLWLLGLASAGAFFFAYGIIEEMLKQKRSRTGNRPTRLMR
jgi:hypothetical protein